MKISVSQLRGIISEEILRQNIRKLVMQEVKVAMLRQALNAQGEETGGQEWSSGAVVAVEDASENLSDAAKGWVKQHILMRTKSGAMRTKEDIAKALQSAPKEIKPELSDIASIFSSDEVDLDDAQMKRAEMKDAHRKEHAAKRRDIRDHGPHAKNRNY
jgi:hypothetical protein